MRRWRLHGTCVTIATVMVAALSGFGGTAAMARVGPPPPAGELLILTNVYSGKCLDIADASTEDFARADQFTCTGDANQQWRYDEQTGSLVVAHSRKCLEVAESVLALGAPTQQVTCTDAAPQMWGLSGPFSPGQTITIRARNSGMCLDVASDVHDHAGGSLLDGASVVQWSCANRPSQQWLLSAVN